MTSASPASDGSARRPPEIPGVGKAHANSLRHGLPAGKRMRGMGTSPALIAGAPCSLARFPSGKCPEYML